MVTLGKSLGGGIMPVSCVLGSEDVFQHIKPGYHGSTYGGNPLACRLAMTTIDVLKDEEMI